jgi:PD-(D/E)XK nuclease superfamily protein
LFNPDELTGALVLEIRTNKGMSRVKFSELAGFTGKSTARLSNIEHRDSWKAGDREAVARVLNQLIPNFDPRYSSGFGKLIVEPTWSPSEDESRVDPPVNVEPIFVAPIGDDDDPEELLLTVGARSMVDLTPESSVEPEPTIKAVEIPDGSYPISNSEVQTWKRCRRKWWLAWYRRLALRTETFIGVRSIGDRIHRALQRWYVPDGTPRVDPRDALERVIVEDWTKIAQLARERHVDEQKQAQLASEFARSTNLERAMIEGYVQWLEETGADAELRVIAAETPLAAQAELPDGRSISLIGKLDVRVKRVTDNVNLFIDHKTVGDLKAPAVTLPQNEQMLHYLLLEFLQSDEGEARCDGALYNMLKRSQRTTRATPPFYDRVEVRHNRFELDSYRQRLLAASRDVLDAVAALDDGRRTHLDVAYPSPNANCKWDCDFFAVCNLLDDGSAGADDMINALYHQVDPRDRYDVRTNDE